jgi:glycosyltransferase involved in cell wall biosynthesis
MRWPILSILLPTYNRSKILLDTIYSLDKYLSYAGNIQFLIGNDGEELGKEWLSAVRDRTNKPITLFNNPTGSLGANLNRLIRNSQNLMLQLDDDHQLTEPFDIDLCVEKMLIDQSVGVVRLALISGHKYMAAIDEIRNPGLVNGKFWRIDWKSPELYICSNRPHLKFQRFHSMYGYYPESLKLGETEEVFCHHCNTIANLNRDHLDVVIPTFLPTETAWEHVGDSWQGKGF